LLQKKGDILHRPLKDYLIVRKWIDKKLRIILDGVAAKEDDVFEVLQVGPGTDDYKPDVKKGDLIAVVGYMNKVHFQGEEFILVRARDAIVVLEKGKE
jgi:co-chaperonin GroES (HSP10)